MPTGTAAPITSASEPLASLAIVVQAHPENTDLVRIGGSGLTLTSGNVLAPGQSMTFPIGRARNIYALAASSGQRLCTNVI
ncbi:hypothetical protein [Sorangium cellulosum]|uniref:Uncharacterized protein n=1 Tax=Sorangium cellulosum TaxID=56 RepID=A0A150QR81_SORCE|nr:hypothetical protein BE15_15205 [Sorangium cellulosum]